MNNEKETNLISGVVNASNVEDCQLDERPIEDCQLDERPIEDCQLDERPIEDCQFDEGQFDEMLIDKCSVEAGSVEDKVTVAEGRNGAEKETDAAAKRDVALLDGDIVERIIGGVVERMASVLRNDATSVATASESQPSESQAGAIQDGNAQGGATHTGEALSETQTGEAQVRRCSTPNFLSDIRPDFWDRV